MKIIIFLFAILLPFCASAGSYEDMEEAMIHGDAAAAIALLQRGVDVNTVDRQGNTLLTQAVRRDVPELVEYLIQHRARLNVRNKNGETALSIAAYTGKLSYVQQFVNAGAEINLYGWPPLTYAAFNGHGDIVDYLLKHGALIDAVTENGSTALLFAARFGHIDIVKVLLSNHADPTITNENGETALDWAVKTGNTEIADLLRAAEATRVTAATVEPS